MLASIFLITRSAKGLSHLIPCLILRVTPKSSAYVLSTQHYPEAKFYGQNL